MSDYKHHKLSDVAEWLWIIADEAPRNRLTDEQRVLLRLFGMMFDQHTVAVLEFERYWRGQAKRRDGFQLIRHAIKHHWPKHWRELVDEHMRIARQRKRA